MLKNGLIDGIIEEPAGGAHRDPEAMFKILSREILRMYRELKDVPAKELVAARIDKFCSMGVYEESMAK